MTDRDRNIFERFQRETANHEMTVKHDDGLYRHLVFRRPDSSLYWFELVTWPGRLAIHGDMSPSFTFSRLNDMFEFFRGDGDGINPDYWAEKVVAGSEGVKTYSEERFKEYVAQELKQAEEYYPCVTEAWQEKTEGVLPEYYTHTEHEAIEALNAFEYLPEGQYADAFSFQSYWDWSLRDFDWAFLWACHAILWGIAQYDAKNASAIAEAVAAGRAMSGGAA